MLSIEKPEDLSSSIIPNTSGPENASSPDDRPAASSEKAGSLLGDIVDFEPGDAEYPPNWPIWRKWTIVIILSMMNMLAIIGTSTIVPAVPQILDDFHVSSGSYQVLVVSIWELGEGLGPFLIGPLSELHGRLVVIHIGNGLSILCAVASALSTNISMLVAFRFLNGFVGTALTLAPSVVGDLFEVQHRGTAMALAMFVQCIGPFLAPIIGSFTTQALGWRWSIWVVAIGFGAMSILSLVFLRETYHVKILEQKIKRLKGQNENMALRSKYQKIVDSSKLAESLSRPLRMILFSPVVSIVSLYTALSYGLAYAILTNLTEIVEATYSFSTGIVGVAFIAPSMGNVLGLLFYGLTSDRYVRHKAKVENTFKPEHRLFTTMIALLTMPLGFFLFGWTLAPRIAWIAPLVGTSLIGFSLVMTMLPTENYLVDVYEVHRASAVAAGVILRALFGALFPLAAPALYNRLGLGLGNSILAVIAIAFVPAVVFIWARGERLRAHEWAMQGR